MPTIFEANFDGSDAIRYFHISLVRMYLDQAYKNATESCSTEQELVFSITSIMFSAMALEAFVNEMSEDVIEKNNLNAFIRMRSPYKKNFGEGEVCAKIRILFKEKFNYLLEECDIKSIMDLVNNRNNLVHYKLTDTAGKLIMPPVKHSYFEDGRVMSTIDFTLTPKRMEPPFVESINSRSAVSGFNTVLQIILKWGELLGVDDYVPGLRLIEGEGHI